MKTVLSVQSRVAAGHVGNSAAVFCMERSGIDVWGVDTVSFSNHPGYGKVAGNIRSAEEVAELIDGIDACFGLDGVDAVLSGYLGRAETGKAVSKAVGRLRLVNPDALFCCDPVMGDGGRIYVSRDIPDLMRDEIVPSADIITPNRFELELLTGRPVASVSDALAAARSLIGKNRLRTVVVTGLDGGKNGETSVLSISADEAFCVSTPTLAFDAPLCGTGDTLAAVFLSRLLLSHDYAGSLAFSVSALFGIIRETKKRNASSLCLIEAQNELEHPSRMFPAEKIS